MGPRSTHSLPFQNQPKPKPVRPLHRRQFESRSRIRFFVVWSFVRNGSGSSGAVSDLRGPPWSAARLAPWPQHSAHLGVAAKSPSCAPAWRFIVLWDESLVRVGGESLEAHGGFKHVQRAERWKTSIPYLQLTSFCWCWLCKRN